MIDIECSHDPLGTQVEIIKYPPISEPEVEAFTYAFGAGLNLQSSSKISEETIQFGSSVAEA
jgi:hypothetical protein